MPTPKKKKYGRATGAITRESYNRTAQDEYIRRANAGRERLGEEPLSEAEEAQRRAMLSDMRNLKSHMGEDYRPIYAGGMPHKNSAALREAGKFGGTGIITPMRMVEEIIMSYPEKELKYRNGGTVKYRSGGMMKYENGGPGPVGSAHSDQKFRVIPEKSPTGQTELAYYIDGRPVESQDFMEQFYAVGNKPQDLNQLIENSVIASKQGIGAESLISGGSPLEGLMKQYRDALKERNVYREQGAAGIDSLYNARQQNYEEMLRRMGG